MAELRAYALGVDELRAVVGATGARAERLRALAHQAYAPQAAPLAVRDLLGPIYRRVPGAPVLRPDEPVAADLDRLLAGRPVPPGRAEATWRLLEAVVAGLAWSTRRVPGADLPPGLLAPVGLPVPHVDGLGVGWCPLVRATTVDGLRDWVAGSDVWSRQAQQAGRPAPDVVVLGLD